MVKVRQTRGQARPFCRQGVIQASDQAVWEKDRQGDAGRSDVKTAERPTRQHVNIAVSEQLSRLSAVRCREQSDCWRVVWRTFRELTGETASRKP